VFEPGQDLAGAGEVAVIEHGVRGPASLNANLGADAVIVTGVGEVGPNTLAELLAQEGFQGGLVRCIACRTGVPNAQGIIFGEELSNALNNRGIPSVVAAPKGPVQVGSTVFGPAPIVPGAQVPAITAPQQRTLPGIFGFGYW
jgi:hypothetical protein